MSPILIRPADHARFRPEDMIRFQWQLAPFGYAQMVRVAIYFGRDSTAPYRDPGHVTRTLLFPPDDPWTGFNETAHNLGLNPGETWYWQISQWNAGAEAVLSDVRAIHIEGQPGTGPYIRFGFNHPVWVKQGDQFKITIHLHNISTRPVQLTFPSPRHFEVAIFRLRLLGADEYVWPPTGATVPRIDILKISAQETHQEIVTWPQVDTQGRAVGPGEYFVRVRCTAQEFHPEDKQAFIIMR
jgi:hypothetical protein